MAKPPPQDDAVIRRFIRLMDRATWPKDEGAAADVARVREQLSLYRRALPFLERSGWLRSAKANRSIDAKGRPIPWYTYPAISFLSEKDFSACNVFEFGSGGSTLWWAKKARAVMAVEHAEEWVEEVRPQLPANVDYRHEALTENGPYSRTAADSGRRFDVIIVDGRDRVNCALNSVPALTEQGVIIWDNAHRARYQVGCDALVAQGFKRLNLYGMTPINGTPMLTSIFYRPGNCLDL
jgi:hypothetical protein